MGNKLRKDRHEDFVRDDQQVQRELQQGLLSAAAQGNLMLVCRLAENRTARRRRRAITVAARNGHMKAARYLSQQYDKEVNAKAKALAVAAKNGHFQVVWYLIECGAIIDFNSRINVLFAAVEEGKVEIVQFLVGEYNVDVNAMNRRGETALMKAAACGHVNVAQLLTEAGADLTLTDKDGCDVLMVAAGNGKLDVVWHLTECSMNLNAINCRGDTALMKAAGWGHFNVVQYLIEVGADLTITNEEGCNALMIAVSSGKLDVVQHLTECALDVNATDKYGCTAVMWAARRGHIDIVRHLANQNASMDIVDKNGDTVLMWAAKRGDIDAVRFLTKCGVDLNIADSAGCTALIKATINQRDDVVQFLVKSGADTNIRDDCGYTTLLRAAESGLIEIVRYVVKDGGADVDITDNQQETAMMKAARNYHVAVVRYLIQHGANVNKTDEHGSTALMLAAKWGNTEVIRCITNQRGLELNCRNLYGSTAVMLAAERGRTEVVQYLAGQCGSDVNIRDGSGNTALTLAVERGRTAVVRYLAGQCGADVNVRDGSGDTPLMLAAENGRTEVVRYLANQCGADANVRDDSGDTALMLAAKEGHTEVVRYLAERHNTIVNAKNYEGTTALMWAVERGHLEIVRLLVQHHHADMNIADNEGNTALMKAVTSKRIAVIQYFINKRTVNVNAINSRGETAFRLAYNHGYQEIQRILVPFLSLNPIQTGSATENATTSSERFCCLIPPSEIALIDQSQNRYIVGEYHAQWLDTNVVVKLYISDSSYSVFEEEVRLWQKLRHPNVIKIYGACTAGSRLQFFVYEYASKGSLIEFKRAMPIIFRRLSTGRRRTEIISATWKLLHDAALGLQYLHERGVVHGDLRCSNILIGNDGLAKLSNFRLRGSMDTFDIMPSRFMGSIRWQSPEVVKGEKSSFASDVYSLGMSILEAATMKEPWYDVGTNSVLKHKAKWNPHKNRGFGGPSCPPGNARDLVWRMCCQDPSDRPSLISIVYELERLSMKTTSVSHMDSENLISFDGYELGKLSEVWRKVQGHIENCDNEQYCRIFEELNSVHNILESSTDPTLLAKFYALLTEFYQTIKMSPEQARIVRLSSTRATTTSFYALHWRIESLLKILQGSTDTLTWRKEQWQQQRNEQIKFFVSGISDTYLLLKDLKSAEERSAFLNVLKTEMENFQSKYTADQLEAMKTTYDAIVAKIGPNDLLSLTPEWFIPWYELIIDEWSELGKGGFGSVCRGKWLDSDVVVKQVLLIGDKGPPDYSYSSLSASLRAPTTQASNTKRDEVLTMFHREVEIWFGLSHPHVIRLFGACHVGRPFFVCEHATNGTMISYLRKHPDQLWMVLLEAALGVQYLQARGIIHGDLKGNNIVIGSDKKAKVTDFGLSSIAKNDDDKPEVSAALHWVAPECLPGTNANTPAQAKTGPTFASDVYSLGMCIVEALRVVENVEAVKRSENQQSCLPWGGLDHFTVKYYAKQGNLPAKPTICKDGPWDLVKRVCSFEPGKRIKISTVVDELMMLAAGVDQHMDSSPTVNGWRQKSNKIPIHRQSENLRSVSRIIAKVQKRLARWKNTIIRCGLDFFLYSSLWEHIEHVRGQIDDSHSPKCHTMYCSLVVEATEAMLKLENASPDLTFLTEATMRCYELERRLEKFCEAYFLVFKPQ